MIKTVAQLPGLRAKKPAAPLKFSRNEYKAQWNSVSVLEINAKFAVSGATDEGSFVETAEGTKAMLQGLVGISASDVVLEIGAALAATGRCSRPSARNGSAPTFRRT